jgi:hypothetical protein
LRHDHGVIAAAIIHEDDQIHQLLLTHFVISLAQRFSRIVGGHDNDDFLIPIHDAIRVRMSGAATVGQRIVSPGKSHLATGLQPAYFPAR